jgi:hypothetical protein
MSFASLPVVRSGTDQAALAAVAAAAEPLSTFILFSESATQKLGDGRDTLAVP